MQGDLHHVSMVVLITESSEGISKPPTNFLSDLREGNNIQRQFVRKNFAKWVDGQNRTQILPKTSKTNRRERMEISINLLRSLRIKAEKHL
jgi:hypothetical protein